MRKCLLVGIMAAIVLFTGCPSTGLNSANIYIQQGEYEKAKEQVQTHIATYPNDFLGYCVLGKAEIGLYNWIPASDAFRKAYALDSAKTLTWLMSDAENKPVYWQAFYNAAINRIAAKQLDEALSDIWFAKQLDPGNVDQFILEGNIYAEKGDKTAARKTYERIVGIEPDNPEAYFYIGDVLFQKQAYDSSLQYFTNATRYFEKKYEQLKKALFQNVEFDAGLAQEMITLFNEKKNDELDQLLKVKLGLDQGLATSRKNVERFAKTNDGLLRSHYYTGMAHYYLKEDTLAVKELEAALTYSPNDINALFFAGELLLRSEQYDAARAHFETVTSIKPDDFAAWFYVGVCYAQTKKFQKAIEIYEQKALPLQPENIDLLNNLAYAHREAGNNKKALEYLMKVDKLQKKEKP